MLYILLIFTCIDGQCTVEPTAFMDITYQQCMDHKQIVDRTLSTNSYSKCIQLDTE